MKRPTKTPVFRSWGNVELDRLWREMYEAERVLDDIDLATDSPRLRVAEQACVKFREALDVAGAAPVTPLHNTPTHDTATPYPQKGEPAGT